MTFCPVEGYRLNPTTKGDEKICMELRDDIVGSSEVTKDKKLKPRGVLVPICKTGINTSTGRARSRIGEKNVNIKAVNSERPREEKVDFTLDENNRVMDVHSRRAKKTGTISAMNLISLFTVPVPENNIEVRKVGTITQKLKIRSYTTERRIRAMKI